MERTISRCVFLLTVLLTAGIALSVQYEEVSMTDLLSEDQQDSVGIVKLNESEREHLRLALIEKYLSGYEQGKKDVLKSLSKTSQATPQITTQGVIESKIDGEFEGWEGETIVN